MMWGDQSLFGNNMCRLCAGTEEVCIPIFNKDGDARILHKIKRCIPISVSEHDEKPKQLCYSCMSKLEISYALGKDDHLGHHLDPLLELRSSSGGIWQTVKTEESSTLQHQHTLQADVVQRRGAGMDANQTPATVTVEHVEARGDGHSGEGLDSSVDGTEGAVSDILLMVELKYKDVLGEGTSKVPTITYATSDHTATLDHKTGTVTTEAEHQVIELIPQEARISHVTATKVEQPAEISSGQVPTQNKKFQCNVCYKFFMRRSNLNSHLATHSAQRPFACDLCLKSFCSRWDLTVHKRLHSKQFSCDVCDKVFSVRGKLERHKRTHTGEKPFPCIHCPKAFSDKRNMQAHMRCHTGEKPFSCEVCGKAFRCKSHLSDHSRVHTIDKPFTCHICGKNFKWKTTLSMHLKFHAGEQYSCDLCGKKFSRRADLKKHVMSHSMERPYSCKVCSKNFKDASTLRKHTRSHNAEKPYSCYQCGKTFHFQWYLSSHLKVHQPHICMQCGVTFEKKAMFMAHKKSPCVKLFKCKYCNEECESEEAVVQHMHDFHATTC
ncbi:hypothetical protein B566_EDAN012633 [Ephemera danica]|nr:hypothetical protein B566_EDAN012633 [Ephemera danica]